MHARAASVLLAALAVLSPRSSLSAQGTNTADRVPLVTPASGATSDARGTVRVRLSVATRALQRGDTLRAADIAVVDTTIVWRWSTAIPDTTRAHVGWVTRRAISVGEVLRYPAVGASPVVHVGQRVSAIYQDGPVRILLTGTATNSAALGAPVGVRIDPTRRLDGIAVALNSVRLR